MSSSYSKTKVNLTDHQIENLVDNAFKKQFPDFKPPKGILPKDYQPHPDKLHRLPKSILVHMLRDQCGISYNRNSLSSSYAPSDYSLIMSPLYSPTSPAYYSPTSSVYEYEDKDESHGDYPDVFTGRGICPEGSHGIFNLRGSEEVKLYVCNLAPKTTEASVHKLFQQYGHVSECFIRFGNAYVTMPSKEAEHICRVSNTVGGIQLNGHYLRMWEAY